jgi:hypothetical protein
MLIEMPQHVRKYMLGLPFVVLIKRVNPSRIIVTMWHNKDLQLVVSVPLMDVILDVPS